MVDISREDDRLEVADPPRFAFGERVVARSVVRNDGTYCGRDIGDVLVNKGDVGYITGINTFLQQFYIYAVDFVETGHRVGMRAKELCTLDHLPEDVLARLSERLGEAAGALQALGRGQAATVATAEPDMPGQRSLPPHLPSALNEGAPS